MHENAAPSTRSTQKTELSIHIDSELLDEIRHLTNDPSKVIEVALRQWLKGESRRDDDLTHTFQRNPPVPPRGEWND
ncbi:MAG: type II toxin-antitoxin system CcdA family antitoxin [Cyanobacteria bacterium]|nr:type II toxin-antitoxin system CcdA family antitoxin [Cyanobacteriota bacterium]MDW8199870.1 type II toxin-antitoxin system CcdA family antitoxin [Cyanobacteriota bacterium SKYGB_h_bin112]